MTINHIDQLAQWYADAEQVTKTNLPRKGDTLIYPRRTSGYIIESYGGGWIPELVHSTGEPVRILARAPKPKPAWVNARAIIAHTDGNPRPSVWTWHAAMERWDDEGGCHWANTEDLRDVTPLIEAKVTDEMVERIREASRDGRIKGSYWGVDCYYRAILTAALGLETE